MEKLARSSKITIEVISGQEALATGHEAGRALWNFARYCAVGHNWKVRRWRGHWPWEVYKDRMPKFASGFDMQKELRDTDECKALSSRCYEYTIRELYANMRSWFSNLKSNPKARPPRYSKGPRQLTFEVGANAKPLGDWTYRLTVLGQNTQERHAVVKLHVRPGVKMAQVKMIRVQPDGTGTIVYYTQSQDRTGDRVAAVDLGIINLAVVAFQDGESIMYTGRGLLSVVQGLEKKAAKCKPSGWTGSGDAKSKPSKQKVAYLNKLAHIRKMACHNLTRDIIDECEKRQVGTLVIGDLTGIRDGKDWGKKGNQRLHAWPFAEIRRQLEYKAQEKGIEAIAVSEAYTSKTCHFCGVIGKRVERGKFICKDCGVEINADVNGAFGILNKVSPERVCASFGVAGNLPARQSPPVETARFCKVEPTIIAKFDLGNWSVQQTSVHP
jgi:putative transposase